MTPLGVPRSKTTFVVRGMTLSDLDIDPECKAAVLALPDGGNIFNYLYNANYKKVSMLIDYVFEDDRSKTFTLTYHFKLLLHLTSFCMFLNVGRNDYKELALRMATGQHQTGDPDYPPNTAFMSVKLDPLIRDSPIWKPNINCNSKGPKLMLMESPFDRFKEYVRRTLWDIIWGLPHKANPSFKWFHDDPDLVQMLMVCCILLML
jgi:hypothetical protein